MYRVYGDVVSRLRRRVVAGEIWMRLTPRATVSMSDGSSEGAARAAETAAPNPWRQITGVTPSRQRVAYRPNHRSQKQASSCCLLLDGLRRTRSLCVCFFRRCLPVTDEKEARLKATIHKKQSTPFSRSAVKWDKITSRYFTSSAVR